MCLCYTCVCVCVCVLVRCVYVTVIVCCVCHRNVRLLSKCLCLCAFPCAFFAWLFVYFALACKQGLQACSGLLMCVCAKKNRMVNWNFLLFYILCFYIFLRFYVCLRYVVIIVFLNPATAEIISPRWCDIFFDFALFVLPNVPKSVPIASHMLLLTPAD